MHFIALLIEFEELADSFDKEGNAIIGDNNNKLKNTVNWEDKICCHLVSVEILDLFFTISPLMIKAAIESNFVQCDITYDECKQYP